jgi:glucosamine kinase
MVTYLIGVDGGGTATRARLARSDGTLLGNGEAGPSGLGQGIAQAWANVQQAIAAAARAAGLGAPPAAPDCAIGLGMAGAHVRSRCDEFLAAAPAFARIVLDNDAYTALLGAHAGRPGVIVISGTGSVGEALHADGARVSASGWGFPVGDEGSGAWLGLRAMREAQRALDGRASAGALARAVWGATGGTRDAVFAWCAGAGQRAYAQLAPLVFDAEPSDSVAGELLAAAALELQAVALALDAQGRLPLAVLGSVGRRLQPRFSAALRARCVEPAGDAADGALHLIRQSS